VKGQTATCSRFVGQVSHGNSFSTSKRSGTINLRYSVAFPAKVRVRANLMAITKQTMTDEQRKSLALEYLKAFDNKGVTSSGASILDLFADDAQVFFPKWGLATGKKQIGQLFADFGGLIESILHDYATFNWIMTGSDIFACEGTSAGIHRDGAWRAGVTHGGRWCDVFEVRDFLIQRCFIYLDPDYAGLDTQRYPWLSAGGRDPSKTMGSH
jgi:hypothetical protein